MGAKFGLETDELVDLVEELRGRGLLDSLALLHFHVGSQITAIRGLKEAAQEAGRLYVELVRLGAPLRTRLRAPLRTRPFRILRSSTG